MFNQFPSRVTRCSGLASKCLHTFNRIICVFKVGSPVCLCCSVGNLAADQYFGCSGANDGGGGQP